MADIDNPQARDIVNENFRRTADITESAIRTIDQMLVIMTDFLAIPEIAAAQNEDVILDGAETDGRPICTKQKVLELKFVCEQLQACINTDDRRQLLSKLAVNSAPLF